MGFLKKFDFYRQVPSDLTEPTTPGAVISITCGIAMLFLLVSELVSFLSLAEKSEMFVQQEEGGKLRLHFNMTFPKMPCCVYSLDVLDIMGRHEVGISATVHKMRLSPKGEPLGEYNQTGGGTRDMATEGCNTQGYVDVRKVPGSFHISAHGLHVFVHEAMGGVLNTNHVMHYFWAGDAEVDFTEMPGSLRPIDGTRNDHYPEDTTFEYFFDIIPTIYSNHHYQDTKTYQMTAHMDHLSTHPTQMPAVYFRYQLSPITVKFTKRRKGLSHFLTYVCAIIGGVFTVAGLLNSLLQSSVKAFQKNVLGKGI